MYSATKNGSYFVKILQYKIKECDLLVDFTKFLYKTGQSRKSYPLFLSSNETVAFGVQLWSIIEGPMYNAVPTPTLKIRKHDNIQIYLEFSIAGWNTFRNLCHDDCSMYIPGL